MVVAIVRREGLDLDIKPLAQHRGQIKSTPTPNIARGREHRILHRRVINCAPVPDAPIDQDIEIAGGDADLSKRGRLIIPYADRCEQYRILKRKVVLGVEMNALKAMRQGLRCV